MKYTIRHEVTYPHPVAAVWEFLTVPELLAQWLMANDFKPVVGQEFYFRTNPIPQLQIDGVMHCKIVEMQPMKKLSYTWKAGPGNGVFSLDTLVVWTLEEKAEGTLLRLEHSGFDEVTNLDIYKGMTGGWTKNMQKMFDRLNDRKNDTTNA